MSKLDDITFNHTQEVLAGADNPALIMAIDSNFKQQIKDLMLELISEATEEKPLQAITVKFVKYELRQKVQDL